MHECTLAGLSLGRLAGDLATSRSNLNLNYRQADRTEAEAKTTLQSEKDTANKTKKQVLLNKKINCFLQLNTICLQGFLQRACVAKMAQHANCNLLHKMSKIAHLKQSDSTVKQITSLSVRINSCLCV